MKVVFNEDDVAKMQAKLSAPCNYCDFRVAEGDVLNGLDRSDSSLGYTDANTVSCCSSCNAMKGPLREHVFIDNTRRIAAFRGLNVIDERARARLAPFSGRRELLDAPPKSKANFLTIANKIDIWSSACYLCGRSPCFGIDRVDPDGDYTLDNSRPCCTECNYMKKDLAIGDFERHVKYIEQYTKTWVLEDVLGAPLIICGRTIRQPVALLDDNGTTAIIFPSMGCVEQMQAAMAKAVGDSRGGQLVWRNVTARDYRAQVCNKMHAMSIIKSLK